MMNMIYEYINDLNVYAVKRHLGSLEQKCIPYMKVGIDRKIFNKQTKKPVQRKQGWIHAVRF